MADGRKDRVVKESQLQHECRLWLGEQPDCVVFRNNVGQAEFLSPQGKVSRVRYGLTTGSADLIGLVQIEVTREMVGKVIGRFCAIELKKDYAPKMSGRQTLFKRMVNDAGGYAAKLDDSRQVAAYLYRARLIGVQGDEARNP